MAEQEQTTGIVFTQSGAPVRGSADYQRVYDSRWRFIEIEIDTDFSITLPARNETDESYIDKTTVIKHGLGFIPMFECDFEDDFGNTPLVEIFANKDRVFLKRLIHISGAVERTITGRLRVYNLPILEDYSAPKGLPQGFTSPRSQVGIKFIDDNARSVNLASKSPTGFSIDSEKKILSIHKHGLAKINEWINYRSRVTAIDVSTDILTLTSSDPGFTVEWAQTPGSPVSYSPNDFTTYPGGLETAVDGALFYTIPMGGNQVKLASSYENALAGIAINITSAGSLPAFMNGREFPGENSNVIVHDVGYPPTYLFARVDADTLPLAAAEEIYISPVVYNYVTLIASDDKRLYFQGVQAVASDWIGYVILKDPAEIAR